MEEWLNDSELHSYIKKNKIELYINYISESGEVKFQLQVFQKRKTGIHCIIDYKQKYPLSDLQILNWIKSIIRAQKIDKIL